jgi:hypothetical protein
MRVHEIIASESTFNGLASQTAPCGGVEAKELFGALTNPEGRP